MSRATRPRPAGSFIAIVACLVGVLITSLVAPVTRDTSSAGTTALDGGRGHAGGAALGAGVGATDELGDDPATTGAAGSTLTAGGGPAAGSVGSSSGGAGAATGAGATGTPGAGATGKVRGVTGKTIKIGLAVAEGGAVESVARIGDTEGHLRAVLDAWAKEGLVPVHGRTIEPVVRTFGLINAEEQRSACVSFAQDDEVFMVLAPLVFVVGAECLAREFQVPVIASAGAVPGDEWFARTHPYGFYTNMSDTRVGVNFIHWAHHEGLLKGKRIGLNYLDDPLVARQVQVAIKDTLRKLGYKVALDFPSPEESESIAVQRFIAEDIDMAVVMGGNQTGPRAADFTQAAQVQGYRPSYILSEFLSTSTLAPGFADSFHPDQFDGMKAMTYYRRAEDGRFGNPPIPKPGVQCERQYEAYSGRQIDRFADSNEWDALQHACDQGRATITSLHAAGRNLTALGFVRAMETSVKNQESGEVADIGFSPTKHDGANAIKTMRWSRSCLCWLHGGPYRPPYVG